jgi:surface protein
MALAHRAKVKDPAKAFISTWRTSTVYTGSTADNQIKLPLEIAGTYKFTVQWGDTTSSVITTWNQAETTHTYPAPGDYTVTITGFIKGWDWGGGGTVAPTTGDMRKLLTVTQFGCLRFVTHESTTLIWGAFYGCTNLNLTAVQDMPNFKGCTSTLGFLRGCSVLTTINNINKWDVSRITFFRNMLRECTNFNDNVGNWNVGKATSMAIMFFGSTGPTIPGKFTNGGSPSIGNWDTSNVTDMNSMFTYQPSFNQNIGAWDVSKVTAMQSMFFGCTVAPFGTFDNGGSDSINNWDTGSVTNMAQTFFNQPVFNRNIGNWNTSNVTSMSFMFNCPSSIPAGIFNKDISNWNTSKVTNMASIFANQKEFNQEVGKWNTSLVTSMSFMFGCTGTTSGKFNNAGSNSIKNWNTGNVTNMSSMFQLQLDFDQEIGTWDVSKVTTFLAFAYGWLSNSVVGKFNNGGSPSINNWNLGSTTSIDRIFYGQGLFNQPINGWNTTTVTNMGNAFTFNYAFNQPIGNWNVSNVTSFAGNFMNGKTFNDYSAANYDALLIGWSSRPVIASRSINFGTIKYTAAAVAARAILTSAPNNWTIVDGGLI